MIRNFIYDFGKVLVDYDFPLVIDTYFPGQPEREAEFMEKIMTVEWQQRQDRAVEPWDEVIAEMKRQNPQFEKEIDRFDKRFTDFIFREMPGMREVLMKLKERGYHLYGLSNWSSKVRETQAKYPEIFSLLDGEVVSFQVHLLKPEPEIYVELLHKYGLKAEECLFADDRPENIEAALGVGMDGIVFTNTEAYVAGLAERGIIL